MAATRSTPCFSISSSVRPVVIRTRIFSRSNGGEESMSTSGASRVPVIVMVTTKPRTVSPRTTWRRGFKGSLGKNSTRLFLISSLAFPKLTFPSSVDKVPVKWAGKELVIDAQAGHSDAMLVRFSKVSTWREAFDVQGVTIEKAQIKVGDQDYTGKARLKLAEKNGKWVVESLEVE